MKNNLRISIDPATASSVQADLIDALDVSAMVSVADPDGTVAWVNDRFLARSGYTREDLIGQPYSRLDSPFHDKDFFEEMSATLATGALWHGEICHQARDGSLFWTAATVLPRGGVGAPLGYVAVECDITEQKRVSASAREAEQVHRTIVDSLAEGIVLQAADGSIVAANPSALRILGLDLDQMTGRTSLDPRWRAVRDDGSDFPGDQHPAMVTLRTGEPQSGVVMGVHKPDGSLSWISINSAPIFRPGEDEPSAAVASFTDITDRRRAEEEVRKHNATLEAILASLPVGVMMLDRDRRIVAWNRQVQDLFDLPDALLNRPGLTFDELVRFNADRGEFGRGDPEALAAAWTAEWTRTERSVRERRRPNGRIVEMVGTGTPDGSLVTTYTDVTARRKAESAIRASEERFRTLFELSPVGLGLVDPETRTILIASQALNDTLGLPQSETGPIDLERVFPVLAGTLADVPIAATAAGWRFGPTETEMVRADGQRLPVLVTATAVGDVDGSARLLMVAQDIAARRRHEQQLWDLANLDTLTGLPNRMQFNARLAEAIDRARRSQTAFALVLFDVDEFKEINDSFGHDAGDDLLRSFAGRLTATLRATDTVARLGGDEFAAILTDVGCIASIQRPLEAIIAALREPVTIGGVERRCTASIGVTLYPDDATEPADLMKNADIALYRAKAAGRDRYEMFQPQMRDEIARRSRVKADITGALARDELVLHYQPLVRVADGSVIGYEALLRWQSREHGLVGPGQFFDVFDDAGMAAEIGLRVLGEAAAQIRAWHREGVAFGRIGINVTSADFRTDAFVDQVARELGTGTIRPADISIEVTERMFLGRGAERVGTGLQRLHDFGIEIAFDDFGTGYASLTHLKRFPIDVLKIDRSFVENLERDAEDQAIVAGIVQLAHSLGKSVVAEGVSSAAQVALLRATRCDVMQGFAVGHPVSAAAVSALALGPRRPGRAGSIVLPVAS